MLDDFEDQAEISSEDDVKALCHAWVAESVAPSLLDFNHLVDKIQMEIQQREDDLDDTGEITSDSAYFSKILYHSEIDRFVALSPFLSLAFTRRRQDSFLDCKVPANQIT